MSDETLNYEEVAQRALAESNAATMVLTLLIWHLERERSMLPSLADKISSSFTEGRHRRSAGKVVDLFDQPGMPPELASTVARALEICALGRGGRSERKAEQSDS